MNVNQESKNVSLRLNPESSFTRKNESHERVIELKASKQRVIAVPDQVRDDCESIVNHPDRNLDTGSSPA